MKKKTKKTTSKKLTELKLLTVRYKKE